MQRVVILILDGFGAGAMPDAQAYGDDGADTLNHIHASVPCLDLPNLAALGLYRLLARPTPGPKVTGSFGRMFELSAGKDTTVGHWELMGLVVDRPFPTYPGGFPPEVMREFERRIGRGTLGNCAASGTEIIARLGPEHIRTGEPIVYTSADSVFQVAAHEQVVPVEELYSMCRQAREMLGAPPLERHRVARVIARPFIGDAAVGFTRTANRRDFSLEPEGRTLLDLAVAAGVRVVAIGKIEDIFAKRGITNSIHTQDNPAVITATVDALKSYPGRAIIFANLVDFDMLWGHRRDVTGYYGGLRYFDGQLPRLRDELRAEDLLIVTADHGNDPTFTRHTDHTREYVPLLCWSRSPSFKGGTDLGTRESFADVGATIAELLGVRGVAAGRSFAGEVFGSLRPPPTLGG